MKKKIFNLSIILLFGIILWGCQSAEDITAPDELSKKGANNNVLSITPINTVSGAETCVELVAGQNTVV